MALKGYSIIDADAHVIEPSGMWADYLEPDFKQFAPSAVGILAGWVSFLNPIYISLSKLSHSHTLGHYLTADPIQQRQRQIACLR